MGGVLSIPAKTLPVQPLKKRPAEPGEKGIAPDEPGLDKIKLEPKPKPKPKDFIFERQPGNEIKLEAGTIRESYPGRKIDYSLVVTAKELIANQRWCNKKNCWGIGFLLRGFSYKRVSQENKPVLYKKKGLEITQGEQWEYAPVNIRFNHRGKYFRLFGSMEPIKVFITQIYGTGDQKDKADYLIGFEFARAQLEPGFKYGRFALKVKGTFSLFTSLPLLEKAFDKEGKHILVEAFKEQGKEKNEVDKVLFSWSAHPKASFAFNPIKFGPNSSVQFKLGGGVFVLQDQIGATAQGKILALSDQDNEETIPVDYKYWGVSVGGQAKFRLGPNAQINLLTTGHFGSERRVNARLDIGYASKHNIFRLFGKTSYFVRGFCCNEYSRFEAFGGAEILFGNLISSLKNLIIE